MLALILAMTLGAAPKPGATRFAATVPAVVVSAQLGAPPRAFVGPPQGRTPRPAALPTVADAKAYALGRLGKRQYGCLAAIVERESGWDPLARNRKSGAFGLPQGIGLKTRDPVAQLGWMIRYSERRYGSLCGAWTFWGGHRWY